MNDKQKDEHYLVIIPLLHTLEAQDHKTPFIIAVHRHLTLSTPLLCFAKTWHIRMVIHHPIAIAHTEWHEYCGMLMWNSNYQSP
jgi:hypothetical protein